MQKLRRSLRIWIALGLLSAMSSCSRIGNQPDTSKVASQGRAVGQYKGYFAINQQLRNRVFGGSGSFFWVGRYFGENYESANGLGALLGVHTGSGVENRFQNGDANSMSMLLWNISMTGLSSDLAALCGGSQTQINGQQLNASFLQKLQRVCRWPDLEARSREAMLALWIQVMGFDAPEAEFEVWYSYFSGAAPTWVESEAASTVRTLLKTIFMNPYFILEH